MSSLFGAEDPVERLIQTGVIQPNNDGEYIFTESFSEDYHQSRERIENEEEIAEDIDSVAELDESFAAKVVAIDSMINDLERNDVYRLAFVLDSVEGATPRSDGVPDSFVPIRCDQIDLVLRSYERVILYFWKEECEPCDAANKLLEACNDGRFIDATRVAVYGPECPSVLDTKFDVGGAPTLLFARHGNIVIRLLGTITEQSIVNCIDVLFEE